MSYADQINSSIKVGNAVKVNVLGRGDVTLSVKIGFVTRLVKMEEVLHVPNFKFTLLSVKVMDRERLQTVFSNGTCRVFSGDRTVLTALLKDSLYVLDAVITEKTKCEMSFGATSHTWHERLAHVKKQEIQLVARGKVVLGV